MADQSSESKSQSQSTNEQQQGDTLTQPDFSQAAIDQAFKQQISSVRTGPVDWAAAYFESCEQQVRTARRVVEIQTLHLMRQEIVDDVTRAVLSSLQSSRRS